MENKNKTTLDLGCTGVLFLIFLVLKLIGIIDWSWLWVTSPIWIPLLFVAGMGAMFYIINERD